MPSEPAALTNAELLFILEAERARADAYAERVRQHRNEIDRLQAELARSAQRLAQLDQILSSETWRIGLAAGGMLRPATSLGRRGLQIIRRRQLPTL